MIQITNQLAENERKVLAPYAVLSSASRGRVHEEPASTTRLCFQKDRDRIIHSRAFRRLKDKTQVFVSHHDDHNRNRLTHTLEVAQISRDLSRMLGLNEDLAEAIALAHDLGHTPFGHAGEFELNKCLREHSLRFEHNAQSKRTVEEIEQLYPGFAGLNLSYEVLDGLMKHETSWDKPGVGGAGGGGSVRPSLEAQIVNLADEVAYQNHDTDDGLRSGLFDEEAILKTRLFSMARRKVVERYGEIEDDRKRISRTVSKMIGIMMRDVYEETLRRIDEAGVQSLEDVYKCKKQLVGFSPEFEKANLELKDFLSKNLYFSEIVIKYSKRGQRIIKALFDYYIIEMPAEQVRDFIAGMTDHFAEQKAADLQLEF